MPAEVGELVDIGGRRLCVHVAGSGGPTVVFENGAGSPSLVWRPVQRLLADEVTTVAYDRAGIGWSDPAPGARSGAAIVDDLNLLLREIAAERPIVLVAHSAGALYARLFQATHPDVVAGMVFVDSVDGHTYSEGRQQLRPLERLVAGAHQRVMPPVIAAADRLGLVARVARRSDPHPSIAEDDGLVAAERALWVGRNVLAGSRAEGRCLEDNARAVAKLPALGDLPLAVVRAGEQRGLFARIDRAWTDTQKRLAALSTRSELVTADGAGHFVQLDRPEVVADAIRRIVDFVGSETRTPH